MNEFAKDTASSHERHELSSHTICHVYLEVMKVDNIKITQKIHLGTIHAIIKNKDDTLIYLVYFHI